MSVVAERLVVGRRGRAIAGPLDFRLEPGRLMIVRGRNGAGKSTLLRTLAGLEAPIAGELTPLPQPIARVPQAAELSQQVPVRVDEVVDLGLGRGLGRHERRRRVAAALERLGIGHLSRRRFANLSAGERQRTLIARALALEPGTILLDEALSNLDVETSARVWELLGELSKSAIVVLVTHEELPPEIDLPTDVITVTATGGAA